MTQIKEKQELIQKLMVKEQDRTTKEKYSYPRLKGWGYVTPSLMSLGFVLYLIMILLTKERVDGSILGILFGGMIPIVPIYDFNEKWENRLQAKLELYRVDHSYGFYDEYDSDLNYTDSLLEKRVYTISKIVCYLLSLVGIVLLAVLGFVWLGSISIAPTTIIIILLIVIIYNQEKQRN